MKRGGALCCDSACGVASDPLRENLSHKSHIDILEMLNAHGNVVAYDLSVEMIAHNLERGREKGAANKMI